MNSTKLYQLNYELVCKLLSINYSEEFSSKYKCPPISRYYFCHEINQAQQFFALCCLSAYILNKLDSKADFKVDIFDDPTITIDNIVMASGKYIDINSFSQNKNKLKDGYGLEVLSFLNNILDVHLRQTMKNSSKGTINFIRIDGTNIKNDDDEDDDDEAEDEMEADDVNEIELEEETDDYIITEEESPFVDVWDEQTSEIELNNIPAVEQGKKEMIISTTNSIEWNLELERVLPQLTARTFGKILYQSSINDVEWRLHYQTMRSQQSNIETVHKEINSSLGHLINELQSSIEKIRIKEKHLHQNADTILAEWANVKDKVVKFRETFDAIKKETEDKSQRLQELNDENRNIKQSVEEYSFRMTDNSPLLEAKKARDILKQDLIKVNLQIGVAIQTLVRHASIYTSAFF